MHYKNGRVAQNGDKIVSIPSYGPPVAGILYDATPGNASCNGRIAVPKQTDVTANLSECLHADDVAKASIPHSTVPLPASGA
jgi:hypothetical protein